MRDGRKEGKRELRSAFNADFFLSCSFHIIFFLSPLFHTAHSRRCLFSLKVKCRETEDLWFLRPLAIKLTLSTSASLPLPLFPSAPKHPGYLVPTVSDCQTSPLPLGWPCVPPHTPLLAATPPPPLDWLIKVHYERQ